jgi:GntR family transcriptional regulator
VPLLVATQLAYNQDGRPLEYTVAAYRGDRYRFTATITSPA